MPVANSLQSPDSASFAAVTRIKTAWRTARDGTKRTTGWAARGVRDSVRSPFTPNKDESAPPADGDGAKQAAAAQAEETPGTPGRRRRIAIFAAAGLVVAIWIGWTAYVWNENGSTAGIGVLISWPAVFAALALVSVPFLGAGLFVRSQRTGGEADLAAPETTTVGPEAAEDPAEDSKGDSPEAPDTSDPAPTTASQPGTPHAASPHHRSPVGSLSEAEDVPADDDAEDDDHDEDDAVA